MNNQPITPNIIACINLSGCSLYIQGSNPVTSPPGKQMSTKTIKNQMIAGTNFIRGICFNKNR